MLKGRGGVLFVLIIIVLAVIVFILLRGGGDGFRLFGTTADMPAIPLDLQPLVPTGWDVQRAPQVACSFDTDEEPERLLIYRYNPTSVRQIPAGGKEELPFAPFGAVIYDTQADTLQPQPESPGPYRPSNLVPYKLLPDYYAGKGQGYLGETGVEIRYSPGLKEGAGCKTDEIYIFGYSGGDLPTRLSIFRWASPTAGYQGPHFVGDARIDVGLNSDDNTSIDRVITYNRLRNHRSLLCEVAEHVREIGTPLLFSPVTGAETVDFCFGAPAEPVYPEGVVVALLRGKKEGNGLPAGYLLENAVLPPELDLRNSDPQVFNIVSVGNPSSVEHNPGLGKPCTPQQVGEALSPASTTSATPATWKLWCSRERVSVTTRILLNGSVREATWTLTSIISDRPNSDLIWRIEAVELS